MPRKSASSLRVGTKTHTLVNKIVIIYQSVHYTHAFSNTTNGKSSLNTIHVYIKTALEISLKCVNSKECQSIPRLTFLEMLIQTNDFYNPTILSLKLIPRDLNLSKQPIQYPPFGEPDLSQSIHVALIHGGWRKTS